MAVTDNYGSEDHVPLFTKSRHSGGGNCVEVAVGPEIRVRDSKDSGGPVLIFSEAEWSAFLAGVRDGEFDPAANNRS
jgi:hypothetical protein